MNAITKTFSKFSLATASFGLALGSLAQTDPVQAAAFDFTVSILSGDLAGETGEGSFSFDENSLTEAETEFLPVSSLRFNFLGSTFTEADAPFEAEAAFFEGKFLGLSYSVEEPDLAFSFIPGFFEVNEAFFAYDLTIGTDGTGDAIYTPASDVAIPEPSGVGGILLSLSLFGRNILALAKRK